MLYSFDYDEIAAYHLFVKYMHIYSEIVVFKTGSEYANEMKLVLQFGNILCKWIAVPFVAKQPKEGWEERFYEQG